MKGHYNSTCITVLNHVRALMKHIKLLFQLPMSRYIFTNDYYTLFLMKEFLIFNLNILFFFSEHFKISCFFKKIAPA